MKAMIFAAGLGTRLQPLTDHIPKALVEVNGKSLLERVIERLKSTGVDHFVINVHHLSSQVIDFIERKDYFKTCIDISDESGQLLDTGGGLKKAACFLQGNEPFIVHNVDVLSDIDLNNMFEFHQKSGALATLAVRDRDSSRKLLFDGSGDLTGWKNDNTHETIQIRPSHPSIELAFSGIHIISPGIFDLMKEEGVFSIIDVYLRLARSHQIKAFRHDDSMWLDVGSPEKLKKAIEGEGKNKT